jgi:hypothetical protein
VTGEKAGTGRVVRIARAVIGGSCMRERVIGGERRGRERDWLNQRILTKGGESRDI